MIGTQTVDKFARLVWLCESNRLPICFASHSKRANKAIQKQKSWQDTSWVLVLIPSNLDGRKDCFQQSFHDTSALYNDPYTREIVNLSFREFPQPHV